MNKKISKSLVFITIVFIFSLIFATKALSQTSTLHFTFDNNSSGGKIKPLPAPPCTLVDAELRSLVDVKITGSGATCRAKQIIFRVYSVLINSQKYANLLKKGGGFNIVINYPKEAGSCSGLTSGNTITLSGFTDCLLNDYQSTLIVHETGHVMRNKNYFDFQTLYQARTYSELQNQDSSCYDRGYIKTYSYRCGSSCGISATSESFAEASMLFVYNSKIGLWDPSHNPPKYGQRVNNFKQECPATYNYIRDAVFGGIEFND